MISKMVQADRLSNSFLIVVNSGSDKPYNLYSASAKPKRDPETIKTINDLMKAAFQDFHMQPKAVLKELVYSSQNNINEKPSELYMK
jgi:hypothetical protein